MQRWVWTTFNSFQWDLNYANPAVFCAMAEEMLYLANAGVEVLRLDAGDPLLIQMAVRRIMMMRSIMLSIGGIPLIYIGDEWGMLNDYTYLSDPTKVSDSRWVHRSRKKWHLQRNYSDPAALEWRFFNGLKEMIGLRKNLPALRNGGMEHFWSGNPHLFAFLRQTDGQQLFIVANFSEHSRVMSRDRLSGFPKGALFFDHIGKAYHPATEDLALAPYQYMWLEVKDGRKQVPDAGSQQRGGGPGT